MEEVQLIHKYEVTMKYDGLLGHLNPFKVTVIGVESEEEAMTEANKSSNAKAVSAVLISKTPINEPIKF